MYVPLTRLDSTILNDPLKLSNLTVIVQCPSNYCHGGRNYMMGVFLHQMELTNEVQSCLCGSGTIILKQGLTVIFHVSDSKFRLHENDKFIRGRRNVLIVHAEEFQGILEGYDLLSHKTTFTDHMIHMVQVYLNTLSSKGTS